MSDIKVIAISKLLLDLENPRFPTEVAGQRAAINLMLELQEDKIRRLAKDIVTRGVDPSENLIVVKDDENPGMYVVAEGNRRTTALKLLACPELADKERVRKIFSKLKEIAAHTIDKVSCVVFDDDGYEHWVNIKHTGDNKGVGRERWTTPELDRYLAKHGKNSYQNQILSFVFANEADFSEVLKRRKFIYSTNIGRLFGDKAVRERFGLQSVDGLLYCNLPRVEFVSKLKIVLANMTEVESGKSKPDFNVKRIYTVADRADYLDNLSVLQSEALVSKPWLLSENKPDGASQDANNDAGNAASAGSAGSADSTAGASTEPLSGGSDSARGENVPDKTETEAAQVDPKATVKIPKRDRNVLIPAGLKLNFGASDVKCDQIFRELKSRMSHDKNPFSIAVMLRVFLDLSVTSLIEKEGLVFKDHPRAPGLHDKVVMCCNFLKEQSRLTGSQMSSICAFSKDKLNAKGTIQQYVHNQHQIPVRDIVNGEWDNLQPLFESIWK